jgi:guanylate kinase
VRKASLKKGLIFVISGPSGSGKTTLRDLLLKDNVFKKKFTKSVSFTTRRKDRLRQAGEIIFSSRKRSSGRRTGPKKSLNGRNT